MFIGKIKGNIVSTHKNEYLKGHKLLSVQPIDLKGNFIGKKDFIAIDLIDAGVGDTVLIVQEGDAVQQVLGHSKAPVNTMIIAIIDDIDIGKSSNNNS
ncbi:MAG: EutN/CcmL family microcompartment protein [Ignavibacteriales bacterium]|nr:EutN/CcmL family microcompartment protein [Ignavibacteriales bacterium]